jgi:fused signal recognition particle receptor
MGYESVEQIVDEVAANISGRVVTLDQIRATGKEKLRQLMAQDGAVIRLAASGPTVIMVCGVNGTGKTTTIAKLARLFKSQGKSVLLGAGDTFRAAAVEQLTIWSDRIGVPIVTGAAGSHPASVAYRAVEEAIKTGTDVCIVDTAGRLQTQKNLMAELTKIQESIRKQLLEAPHEVLLVLDATTGQNGGVVVAIRQQVGLPVKYVGVGEKADDLTPFVPDEFIDALFDEVEGDDG